MPQLDLPAYPTQLFWLTSLLTLSYWVLHLIAIPSLLLTLQARKRSLIVIKTTIEKAYKQLQLKQNKLNALLSIQIKKIINFCFRVQKVIVFSIKHIQDSCNAYTKDILLIFNQPLVISEKFIDDDDEFEFLPDEVEDESSEDSSDYDQLLDLIDNHEDVRFSSTIYKIRLHLRSNTFHEYPVFPIVKEQTGFSSWTSTLINKARYFLGLYLPFLTVIHPFDDFLLAASFLLVFVFILKKYGSALNAALTNTYAQDIKKKFVEALSGTTKSYTMAKSLLLNFANLSKDIKDTYQITMENLLIHSKFPNKFIPLVKSPPLENENNEQ
jgi:hypothetical protein